MPDDGIGSFAMLQQIWFDGKITSLRFLQTKGYQGWRGKDLSGMGWDLSGFPFLNLGNPGVCIRWVKTAVILTYAPGWSFLLQPWKRCRCNLVSRVTPEKQRPVNKPQHRNLVVPKTDQWLHLAMNGRSGWDGESIRWREAYLELKSTQVEQGKTLVTDKEQHAFHFSKAAEPGALVMFIVFVHFQ